MRSSSIVLAGLTLGICSCSSSPPAGPAPTPPSVDATKVSLAPLASGPCPPGQPCFLQAYAEVDPSGELTVLWVENTGTGAPMLSAANIAPGGAAVSSTGVIEVGSQSPVRGLSFVGRSVGSRRFAVLYRYESNSLPPSEPVRARVVDMASSGSPAVGSPVELPAFLSVPFPFRLFQNSALQLYGFVPGATVPFPVETLAPGVTLQVTAVTTSPMAHVNLSQAADFPQSAAARTVWGIHGQELSTDELGIYVADHDLVTGAMLLPLKVSREPVITGNARINCLIPARDLETQALVDNAGVRYVVPWHQVNATGDGCDLYVNGERVNTGPNNVEGSQVSLQQDGSVVAVWEERDAAFHYRVLWSRRGANAATWSTPAPIAPQFSPSGVEQRLEATARSPAGTLAVVWSSGNNFPAFISKYQTGWTTVQVEGAGADDVWSLAINDHGQGGAVFRRPVCSTTGCPELAAYRF